MAGSLGSEPLASGDRYLVLGLTITDNGASGFTSDNFPIGSASFETVYRAGGKYVNGQTDAYCESAPTPGASKVSGEYSSQICSTNVLNPGQSVTGYVVFEVPDLASLLFVIGANGTQSSKPILVIDPDGLVHKSVCDGTATFC